jgi:ABC-type thiamin/hydroxymethylpyrimidine transport system permease subunit
MRIDKMRIRWWWQQNPREVIFVAIIYAVTFAICYFVLHLVNWWVSALIALAATPGETGVIIGILYVASKLRKYLINKRRKRSD